MLEEISRSIEGHTICALGDAAAWPVQVCASVNASAIVSVSDSVSPTLVQGRSAVSSP